MAYDSSNLDKTTPEGRLNIVRLAIGDTDSTNEEFDDNEITYLLVESGDSTIYASYLACNILATKYYTEVDTKADGILSEALSDIADRYDQKAKRYKALYDELESGIGGLMYVGKTKDASRGVQPLPLFTWAQFKNCRAL